MKKLIPGIIAIAFSLLLVITVEARDPNRSEQENSITLENSEDVMCDYSRKVLQSVKDFKEHLLIKAGLYRSMASNLQAPNNPIYSRVVMEMLEKANWADNRASHLSDELSEAYADVCEDCNLDTDSLECFYDELRSGRIIRNWSPRRATRP